MFAGCASAPPNPAVTEVAPTIAVQEMAVDAQIIDVRSEMEFRAYRIAGSRNIPLDSIDSEIGSLDKTKPVYLVCEVGLRSTTAATKFVAAGFSDVRHIEGGIRAWEKAGLPVEE